MINVIILIITSFLSQFLSYKIIKRIDKKQRLRLRKWESKYVEELTNYINSVKEKSKEEEEKW